MSALNSAVWNKPHLIWDHLSVVLSRLYKGTHLNNLGPDLNSAYGTGSSAACLNRTLLLLLLLLTALLVLLPLSMHAEEGMTGSPARFNCAAAASGTRLHPWVGQFYNWCVWHSIVVVVAHQMDSISHSSR